MPTDFHHTSDVLVALLDGHTLSDLARSTGQDEAVLQAHLQDQLAAGPLGILRPLLDAAVDKTREAIARFNDVLYATELSLGIGVLALVSARIAEGIGEAPSTLTDVLRAPKRGLLGDLLRDLVSDSENSALSVHPVVRTWPALDGRKRAWRELARMAPWAEVLRQAAPPGRPTVSATLAFLWWRNPAAHVEVDEYALEAHINALSELARAYCQTLLGGLCFHLELDGPGGPELSLACTDLAPTLAYPVLVSRPSPGRAGESAIHFLKRTKPGPTYHTTKRPISRPDLEAAVESWLRAALESKISSFKEAADALADKFVRSRTPSDVPRVDRAVWFQLRRCITAGDRLVIITGDAGTGKSVLAGQVVEQLRAQDLPVVVAGPAGSSPVEPSEMLLRAVGAPDPAPCSLQQALSLILGDQAEGWLVVDALDEHPNFSRWVQLLQELLSASTTPFHAVVTSRAPTPLARLLPVEGRHGAEPVTHLRVGRLTLDEVEHLLAASRDLDESVDLPVFREIRRQTQRLLRTPLWLATWVRQRAWRDRRHISIPGLLEVEVHLACAGAPAARTYLPRITAALLAHQGVLPIEVAAQIRDDWATAEGLTDAEQSARVGPVEALIESDLLRMDGSGAYKPRHQLLLAALLAATHAPDDLLPILADNLPAREALVLHMRRLTAAGNYTNAWSIVERCQEELRGPLVRVAVESLGQLHDVQRDMKARFFGANQVQHQDDESIESPVEGGNPGSEGSPYRRPPGEGWALLGHLSQPVLEDPRSVPRAIRIAVAREALDLAESLRADHEPYHEACVLFAAARPFWADFWVSRGETETTAPDGLSMDDIRWEFTLSMRFFACLSALGEGASFFARHWISNLVQDRATIPRWEREELLLPALEQYWPIARDSGCHGQWLEAVDLVWRRSLSEDDLWDQLLSSDDPSSESTPFVGLHEFPIICSAVAEALTAYRCSEGAKCWLDAASTEVPPSQLARQLESLCRIGLIEHLCGERTSSRWYFRLGRNSLDDVTLERALDRLEPELVALAAWVAWGTNDESWEPGRTAVSQFLALLRPDGHRNRLIQAALLASGRDRPAIIRAAHEVEALQEHQLVSSLDLLLAALLLRRALTDDALRGAKPKDAEAALIDELAVWQQLLFSGNQDPEPNHRRRRHPTASYTWASRWLRQALGSRLVSLPAGVRLPATWGGSSAREFGHNVLVVLSYDMGERLPKSKRTRGKVRELIRNVGPRLPGLGSQHRWILTELSRSGRVKRDRLSCLEARLRSSEPPPIAPSSEGGPSARPSPRRESELLPSIRRCVDCGRQTGNWCDGCEHLEVMDYPPFPNRPFCNVCEDEHGICRYCRATGRR